MSPYKIQRTQFEAESWGLLAKLCTLTFLCLWKWFSTLLLHQKRLRMQFLMLAHLYYLSHTFIPSPSPSLTRGQDTFDGHTFSTTPYRHIFWTFFLQTYTNDVHEIALFVFLHTVRCVSVVWFCFFFNVNFQMHKYFLFPWVSYKWYLFDNRP